MESRGLLPLLLAWVASFGSPISSCGQAAPDLEAWAGEYLMALHQDGTSLSPNPSIRLERIRAMYFLSVEDSQWAGRAQDSLAALEPLLLPGSDLHIAHAAYRGALEVVRAKHARWPPNKIKHLNRGSEILDGLVGRRPENLEVRYLRLASYLFLPFFLQRGEDVREDMETLSRLLPDRPEAFSPTLYAGVVQFVLEHGELDAETRRRLEDAVPEPPTVHSPPNWDRKQETRS